MDRQSDRMRIPKASHRAHLAPIDNLIPPLHLLLPRLNPSGRGHRNPS